MGAIAEPAAPGIMGAVYESEVAVDVKSIAVQQLFDMVQRRFIPLRQVRVADKYFGNHGLRLLRPVLDSIAVELGGPVRVHSDIPKTVVFIGVERDGRFLPVGTGFIGTYPAYEDQSFYFLITADHVVEMIVGDSMWIRVNRRDGGCSTIRIPKSDRDICYKNDISVSGFDPDHNLFDFKSVRLDREHLEAQRKKWEWDIGDEVAVVGLYGSHFGQLKNVPITRIGHIALMPGEPVISYRGELPAYLVEGKSISGLSGSPVFLNAPMWRIKDEKIAFLPKELIFPIGMVLGYHSVESNEDQIPVPAIQGDPIEQGPLVDRNTGLTTVVPIERVTEMLEMPGIQAKMKAAIEDFRKAKGFKPAGIAASSSGVLTAPPANVENPTHREDFMRLVGAAARKPAQED